MDPFADAPTAPGLAWLLARAPRGLARGAVFAGALAAGSAVVAAFALAFRGGKELPAGARRALRWAIAPAVSWMLAAVGVAGGAPHPVAGGQHLRGFLEGGRGVVVFNHVSVLDGFVLMSAMAAEGGRWPAFVARRESLMLWPVVKFMELTGCLLLGREPGGAAQAIADRVRGGFAGDRSPLAIAPEGRTTNGRALVRFRTGAFLALEPVLPALLRYGAAAGGGPVDPSWTAGRGPGWTVPRLMCQAATAVGVEFLPAVAAAAGETPAEFALRVRDAMAQGLGVPVHG